MTSERLAEIRANLPDPSADLSRRERDSHALLAHVDHLTAENVTLRHAYMAHAEVCDHDEPTVLGQLDNARQNVLDLTAENARLRAGIEELTSVGYSHTPDCEADDWQRVAHGGHPAPCSPHRPKERPMQTPDYINHAARAMDPDAFADRNPQRPSAELQWAVRRKIATDHAQALDAAGLIASPEHDAAVHAAVHAWSCPVCCGWTVPPNLSRDPERKP